MRDAMAASVCGPAISGTRFDNLVCDGFLPLLATRGGIYEFSYWTHWFPGDLPPLVGRALRDLGVFTGRTSPACHGTAQRLLGWLIECERQTSAAAGSGA